MVLGIYGSGGFGREVKEIAETCDSWGELIFIDDTVEEGMFQGIKRVPLELFCNRYRPEKAKVVMR